MLQKSDHNNKETSNETQEVSMIYIYIYIISLAVVENSKINKLQYYKNNYIIDTKKCSLQLTHYTLWHQNY